MIVMTFSCSLNTTTPISSPVKGSSAPKIAVAVEPISCIATAIVKIESMVGNSARPITQYHARGVAMG